MIKVTKDKKYGWWITVTEYPVGYSRTTENAIQQRLAVTEKELIDLSDLVLVLVLKGEIKEKLPKGVNKLKEENKI